MNIMVPVSSADKIGKLCAVGADELYVGIYDEKWNRTFGNYEEINRMSSFGTKANVKIDECKKIINECHNYGKAVYIAFNSGVYSDRQTDYIMRLIQKNELYESDGFIISDIGLILKMLEKNYRIILSTMTGIYNSEIVQFYYNMGIRRMIIPRDVQINNIISLVNKFPEIKFEVFIMRNGCKYADSNCMSYHGRKYGSMCSCIDRQSDGILLLDENMDGQYQREIYDNNKLFTHVFHKKACGLCFVKKLQEAGVFSVKVVGRADNEAEIISDIKIIKGLIEQDEHQKICYNDCWYGLNCYYH